MSSSIDFSRTSLWSWRSLVSDAITEGARSADDARLIIADSNDDRDDDLVSAFASNRSWRFSDCFSFSSISTARYRELDRLDLDFIDSIEANAGTIRNATAGADETSERDWNAW